MAEQFLWTSPTGETLDLTDAASGYRAQAGGTRGLRSVTYEVVSARYAGIDGDTVQTIRAAANDFSLGMLVQGSTDAEFRERARALVRIMRPQPGPGTLTVADESGERRSITCYCVAGLEGDRSDDTENYGSWWRMIMKFYAPDPWWYGDEQAVDFGLGAPTTFFPIFPLELSSSSVQGQFTVDLSDADAPAYPVWTISGPGSSLLLENSTTGRSIQVIATLTAGQTMVIDTRPGRQSVRRGDGTNLMGSVTTDPALWPLIEGVNEVAATLTGATASSRIAGTFQPRFSGI